MNAAIVRADTGATLAELTDGYAVTNRPLTCPSGYFVAVFPRAEQAGRFYRRITEKPGDFYTTRPWRNRSNGRIVSWILDPAQQLRNMLGEPCPREIGIRVYARDMRDTVGSYGSAPDGSVVATLNEQHCPGEW